MRSCESFSGPATGTIHISASTGRPFQTDRRRGAGGGCINEAFVLEEAGGSRRYFVKVNRPELAEMFEAEAAGLAELARPGIIGVPAPVCHGRTGSLAYLVMEGMAYGEVFHRGLGVQRYRITASTRGGHSWADYGIPSAIHDLAKLVTQLTALKLPENPRTSLNVGI